MTSLTNRVRRARVAVSLTQAELSSRLGVQRSAVTQWERDGGTTPNVTHLIQIARETNVCFEWLATGRGAMRPNVGDFDVAVITNDYARDDLEGRVLELIRRLSRKRREAIVQILELL